LEKELLRVIRSGEISIEFNLRTILLVGEDLIIEGLKERALLE
jgi:hypothetical protein